jgi:hypothetical protein
MAVPITDANRNLLRSAYEARTKQELPVLVRWFEGVEPPVANYLLPILYSREQLAEEGEPINADWGVVGCLYTMEPEEIPMVPITMLRNALGVDEGGSSVPLDREAYRRAVGFWDVHVQAAERRVAFQHFHRRLVVEALLEGFGAAILDGVAAGFARKQTGAGERRESDGHDKPQEG